MKKFFSYDPDTGMARHDTAEEAKVSAQSAIDMYRDVAGDPDTGWPEEVEGVCWGEIRQQAKERDTTEETGMGFETCDYELTEIDESAQACVIGVVEETADLRRQLAEAQAAAEGANAAMLNYRAEALEAQARLAELDGERYEQLEREHLGDAEKQTGIYFTSPADQKDAARLLPIETAPKDGTPILGWCTHDADPTTMDDGVTLTEYACAREAYEHVSDGWNVIVWIPDGEEGSWEEGYYTVPGYWALHDDCGECCANPTHWIPLPAAPDAAMLAASPGEANNYHDAYRGARDEMYCWKRRALEAEKINLRLCDALNHQNGPTFMGEPALSVTPPDSPAHRAAKVLMEAMETIAATSLCGKKDHAPGRLNEISKSSMKALATAKQIMEGGE